MTVRANTIHFGKGSSILCVPVATFISDFQNHILLDLASKKQQKEQIRKQKTIAISVACVHAVCSQAKNEFNGEGNKIKGE